VVSRDDQSRILTPYDAIRSGSDFVVIGRPISQADDPAEAARKILDEIRDGLKDRKP
jgi:orotidine-5'-phosphate decarboxylase